jgi:mono/diheme cytochrome c family protein
MSPAVADLASNPVQAYRDGQLKWIIENGIRFSGMPAWKGILTDEEMWYMVRYTRHLPPKGSVGAPKVFEEDAHEHEAEKGAAHAGHEQHH